MKELFQKIEMNNAISFLKAMNLYRKIKRYFLQDEISSTKCFSMRNISTNFDPFKKLFLPKKCLMQDDSLQVNFQ